MRAEYSRTMAVLAVLLAASLAGCLEGDSNGDASGMYGDNGEDTCGNETENDGDCYRD